MLWHNNMLQSHIHTCTYTRTTYVHAQVAVLDIDICGPSIPKVMGLEGEQVHHSGSGWSPVVSVEPFWVHV